MSNTKIRKKHYSGENSFYCTGCGTDLMLQDGFDPSGEYHKCTECGTMLVNPKNDDSNVKYPGVCWFCDNCGDYLNSQKGFTDYEGTWRCAKCGYANPIDEEQIGRIDREERDSEMTEREAKRIMYDFFEMTNPSEEDEFIYTEAMDYLIKTTNNPEYMMSLGGHYYAKKIFDLALKYYEMAETLGYEPAYECLGYIWYYGRTGERDYEKAFKCFSRSAELGNIVSSYKVADMYKNGYFVEKDYEKYKEIIRNLYPKVADMYNRNIYDPIPEIYTRLAKIWVEDGDDEGAIDLYYRAKDFLSQRIKYNNFFGNLNIMKWLIGDLYELIDFDEFEFDLYDLYYVLTKPSKVSFKYDEKLQTIESVEDDDDMGICFNGKWYKGVDEFFAKAVIDDKKLTSIYDELYRFEIIEE